MKLVTQVIGPESSNEGAHMISKSTTVVCPFRALSTFHEMLELATCQRKEKAIQVTIASEKAQLLMDKDNLKMTLAEGRYVHAS